MARVFAIKVQGFVGITSVAVHVLSEPGSVTVQDICWVHWRSVAVQFVSKPESCHGAEFKLSADERVRVQLPLLSCLGCRNKSKNRDKQLTHIVRVSCCNIF
jgi:hypothetical protein